MWKPNEPRPWPEGHPISQEKAKSLADGRLGSFYEGIAISCSAPLLWFRSTDNPPRILNNGTVTVVRTPKKLFGITAAHVVSGYEKTIKTGEVTLQIKDKAIRGLRIIDRCLRRDLATFDLDEQLITDLGLNPVSFASRAAAEGGGLLLAGYPGNARNYVAPMQIEWSPFFAVATARTITSDQISVLVPPDDPDVRNLLPLDCNLGGISGGPMISIFERGYTASHGLSGVITEQPSYGENDLSIERIVGSTTEAITELGNIR